MLEAEPDLESALAEIAAMVPEACPCGTRFGWQGLRVQGRTLTPEQISTAAERYLKPQNMVWVVVGDRAKIEAGIRELNIGEVQFLDADGNLVE